MSKRKCNSVGPQPTKKNCLEEQISNESDCDLEKQKTIDESLEDISISTKSLKYNDSFRYELNNKGKKIGVCEICETINKKRIEIFRTNGSTNGLKNHLRQYHRDVYNQMFADKTTITSNQKSMESCFLVSKIYIKSY